VIFFDLFDDTETPSAGGGRIRSKPRRGGVKNLFVVAVLLLASGAAQAGVVRDFAKFGKRMTSIARTAAVETGKAVVKLVY
jgi:hypothetical protein